MSARLSDPFLYDLGSALAAVPVSESPVTSEIQLCRTGSFYRADMGHFKVTQTTLQKMLTNAQERGVDLPINYFHQGSNSAAPVADRGAAGWVSPSTLSIRSYKGGYGLFGQARWTAEAVTAIRGQTLKYISPEIVWSDTRMAASESGPAGQPIGASLVGAALVNDPFFNLNPVSFSRARFGARKRYSMLSDEGKTNLGKLLSSAGVAAEALDGLLAQVELLVLKDYQTAEAMPAPMEEPMPAAATPAAPADALPGAAALAASRDVVATLTARLTRMEAAEASRQAEVTAQLFERYRSEGRFRFVATPGTDPDGTKQAKRIFGHGVAFAREVFEAVAPLTGSRAPLASGPLPTLAAPRATGPHQSVMVGEDNGAAHHNQVMAELKSKGLKMTDYGRISAHFARDTK